MNGARVVEVFADVGCPFTHVGLRRFVERRAEAGREDVSLWVRSWPLEIVNGQPLDPTFIAEEVHEIRRQVAPSLFRGFREETFPGSSLPALALAAAAYRHDQATGERVSLRLRDALFEGGEDISAPEVLDRVARDHGVTATEADAATVRAEHAEGARRGVVGSPYFITGDGGFFCPALDVSRDDRGHLRILADPEGFERFLESCFR